MTPEWHTRNGRLYYGNERADHYAARMNAEAEANDARVAALNALPKEQREEMERVKEGRLF
jgi:hypothetical protein